MSFTRLLVIMGLVDGLDQPASLEAPLIMYFPGNITKRERSHPQIRFGRLMMPSHSHVQTHKHGSVHRNKDGK